MKHRVKSTATPASPAQSKRRQYLRTLAAALARHPSASLQQLAAESGISRATLYRIAASREALIKMLLDEAVHTTERALHEAQLESGDPLKALERLTKIFMREGDLYLYLAVSAPDLFPKLIETGAPQDPWLFYSQRLSNFFARGQAEGCFRIDQPASWLRRTYDALLLAAVTADLSGELAPADRVKFVTGTFLRGAARAG